jgi:hypothetical protein
MATKVIKVSYETGAKVYCKVQRISDGYFLSDADGTFALSPADPFLAMTESTVCPGLFETTEARTAWAAGSYFVYFYDQVGATPSLTDDQPLLSSGPMFVDTADGEVTLTTLDADVAAITISSTTITTTLIGLRAEIRRAVDFLSDVLKKLAVILSQVLDLEKKIRRGAEK